MSRLPAAARRSHIRAYDRRIPVLFGLARLDAVIALRRVLREGLAG